MILSDSEIIRKKEKGSIIIEPFNIANLGPNSYDLHLSKHLATYKKLSLDMKDHNKIKHFEIPEEGYTLHPGWLYLGSTVEYTETLEHLPIIDGKSSIGRLGMMIHITAGKGDVGFKGHWTLEIIVQRPLKIYPNVPIAQIYYHEVVGNINNPYGSKSTSKYQNQEGKPVESKMFKNFNI